MVNSTSLLSLNFSSKISVLNEGTLYRAPRPNAVTFVPTRFNVFNAVKSDPDTLSRHQSSNRFTFLTDMCVSLCSIRVLARPS